LVEHLEREELHSTDSPLEVRLKSDGRRFELDDLLEDQRQIMTVILCKLKRVAVSPWHWGWLWDGWLQAFQDDNNGSCWNREECPY
jgi:hypothetical protein